MGNRFILWVLSYAWIAFLAGLGLLGMAAYSTWSAAHGGSIPQESTLTSASGHIAAEGREVTVEHRRRRGGKTTRKYYELDLRQQGDAVLKLRVDHDVPREMLESALDEDVTIKYDPNDNNNTYVIQRDDKYFMTYADMARLSQVHADADKATFAAPGMMGFAALLALLGGVGLWWRRKLLASESASASES